MPLREFKDLKGKILFNVPMKRYTTMRVGGPAAALYQPVSIADLIDCIKLSKKRKKTLMVIGNGSNIIIKDKPVKIFFIKLSSPYFKRTKACGTDVSCGAGISLNQFCSFAEAGSLGGCEFLTGIPGTIGGAIAQNAGAHAMSISDILKDIRCVDGDGRLKILKRQEISFGYRKSGMDDYIIVSATFHLKKTDKEKIRKRTGEYIEKRLVMQDYTAPSAGCIFKNPENTDLSAGQLIDRCGLKGIRAGGAFVSQKHANFIINKDKADAKDVLALIKLIKNKVKKEFGVSLEEEVKIIG